MESLNPFLLSIQIFLTDRRKQKTCSPAAKVDLNWRNNVPVSFSQHLWFLESFQSFVLNARSSLKKFRRECWCRICRHRCFFDLLRSIWVVGKHRYVYSFSQHLKHKVPNVSSDLFQTTIQHDQSLSLDFQSNASHHARRW